MRACFIQCFPNRGTRNLRKARGVGVRPDDRICEGAGVVTFEDRDIRKDQRVTILRHTNRSAKGDLARIRERRREQSKSEDNQKSNVASHGVNPIIRVDECASVYHSDLEPSQVAHRLEGLIGGLDDLRVHLERALRLDQVHQFRHGVNV